jgi:Fe-only nitrogenase accessory protein AnfO
MFDEIAVYLGENGETASLYEKGKVVIYQKEKGQWRIAREKDFSLQAVLSIKDLRTKMQEIIMFLHECKIFVGRSIVGIPYYILEKVQCSVWECSGKPKEFLTDIWHREEEERRNKMKRRKSPKSIFPVEVYPGVYTISLKEIQKKDSQLTSKQVLLPFLRKGEFESLEVLCNHIPLWLEGEILAGNFDKEIMELNEQEMKIVISRRVPEKTWSDSS